MIDLSKLTIKDARTALDRGDFSASDLTNAYLEEIKKKDGDVHAYLEVFDDVHEQAENADERIKDGTAGILTGIPLAMKDNILIRGKRAGASSKILEGYRATYNATVTDKLEADEAVFLGRTNCDEFAMGSSTENSAYGTTRNPIDLSRVPGGSSGGSAAAVAGGMALGAFGSDTGGSIRQPAALCGIVGLKPTYGAVSRHGLIAMGSSLDCIGSFGKTVSDVEILFNATKGHDPMDSTTYPHNTTAVHDAPKTIGVPWHLIEREGIDPRVLANFKDAVARLKNLGYEIVDIELPTAHLSLAVYYIIMPAEVSTNLARFDGVKYGLHKDGENLLDDYLKTRSAGFGPEARRRIILGTYVLSSGYYDAYYGKAVAARRSITEEFTNVFKKVDAIAMPTTPTPAFKVGAKTNDPLAMYLEDIFTVPANIAGIPAISAPSGTVTEDGIALPVGLQLLAPHQGEDILFTIGKTFLGEAL